VLKKQTQLTLELYASVEDGGMDCSEACHPIEREVEDVEIA
jgi:hypothetical protein